MSREILCNNVELFGNRETGANSAIVSGNIVEQILDDGQDKIHIVERPNASTTAWRKELNKFVLEHPICKPLSFFEFYKGAIKNLLRIK